jgi:acetyl esterase/lipase
MLPKRRAGGEREEGAVVIFGCGVGIRIHRPRHIAYGPALLWIYGGGYVLGHAAMDDKHCRRLAHEPGATVARLNIALHPEHPYPAALEDCLAALERLAREPTLDASRIAVAGPALAVESVSEHWTCCMTKPWTTRSAWPLLTCPAP